MKIIALTAENVKRLVAVEIRPDGDLVEISGRNGQGKTSVLDAIWWALAGTKHIQAAPIRKGAAEARIRLDLGDIIVSRKFRRHEDGGQITTSLIVENTEGARFPSPQRLLDGLLGELAFDPLAFTRMAAGDQFEALKRFAPGIDFDALEAANHGDYERRRDVNRDAKSARAAAEQIVLPPDTPPKPVDEAALIQGLDEAGRTNAEIEQRKARREQAAADIATAANTARLDRERAAELRRQAATLDVQAEEQESHVAELQAKLDTAPPLPAPIDTAELRQQIDEARVRNAVVSRHQERERHRARAEELEAESKALTEAMEERETAKRKAVSEAQLPVEGLGFGDGMIVMNGVPFDQASDAEQLRVSIAVAAAMNPKLRVIRVRDGSLLDDEGMRLLAEFAKAQDMQVWVERVASDGRVGFVLEDGQLRAAAPAAAAE